MECEQHPEHSLPPPMLSVLPHRELTNQVYSEIVGVPSLVDPISTSAERCFRSVAFDLLVFTI